jgi:hypothetical protein
MLRPTPAASAATDLSVSPTPAACEHATACRADDDLHQGPTGPLGVHSSTGGRAEAHSPEPSTPSMMGVAEVVGGAVSRLRADDGLHKDRRSVSRLILVWLRAIVVSVVRNGTYGPRRHGRTLGRDRSYGPHPASLVPSASLVPVVTGPQARWATPSMVGAADHVGGGLMTLRAEGALHQGRRPVVVSTPTEGRAVARTQTTPVRHASLSVLPMMLVVG